LTSSLETSTLAACHKIIWVNRLPLEFLKTSSHHCSDRCVCFQKQIVSYELLIVDEPGFVLCPKTALGLSEWLAKLARRTHHNVIAMALAKKLARIS
jgi:hypothetical protein